MTTYSTPSGIPHPPSLHVPSGQPLRNARAPFARPGLLAALVLATGLGALVATAQNAPVTTAQVARPVSDAGNRDEADMLIKAIDHDDEQLFSYLLKQGADVNGTGSKGWTPLGFAAHEGRLQFVRLLLERGARADQPASGNRTPLLAAAAEGHAEVVKLLLAKVDRPAQEAWGSKALGAAAREGHADVVRVLLDNNVRMPKTIGEQDHPLVRAAAEGHADVVELLLAKEDKAARADLATAALPRAAREGRLPVVSLLLDNGARLDKPADRDGNALVGAAREGRLDVVQLLFDKAGGTANAGVVSQALGAAAREGRLDVVRFLLDKGVKMEGADGDEHDPLLHAAREGHEQMVALLLEKGDKATRADRATRALPGAAREGRAEVVRLLLNNGARLGTGNDREESPFVAAAREGRLEVVEMLFGKIDNAARDELGNRALRAASQEGRLEVVRFLLNSNFTIQKPVRLHDSPLVRAAAEGRAPVVELLLDKMNDLPKDPTAAVALLAAAREGRLSVVEQLIGKGIPVNTVTEEGRTALSEAAREGREAVVDYLLTHGAEVNKGDGKGRTPLHAASAEGRTKVVQRLLAAGANVAAGASAQWMNMNYYNNFGHGMRITLENWTPLLFAVSEKREETVKVLLAAGANVNVRGRKTVQAVEQKNRHEEPVVKDMLLVATGWTPLMEAAERESIQLVQLLLAAGADKNARTEEGITAAGVAQKTGNREIIELLK